MTRALPQAYLRARPRPAGSPLPGAATEQRGLWSCVYGPQDSRRDAVTNHLIQPRPLFGRRERRSPHGPWRQRRDGPGSATPEPSHLALGKWIVLGQLHSDELRGEVEHERGVELAAVRGSARIL